MYPALLFELLPCSCITYIIFKTCVIHHKKLNIVAQDDLIHMGWDYHIATDTCIFPPEVHLKIAVVLIVGPLSCKYRLLKPTGLFT